MKVTSVLTAPILAAVILALGCATSKAGPASPGHCEDRTRFGYPDSLTEDDVQAARLLIQSIGADGESLLPIPGGRPDVLNRREVARALERAYPNLLMRQGIGGTARAVILVAESGRVEVVEISESSGHPRLDEAARSVAMQIEFTGLRYENAPICYVATFPVSFMMR